MPVTEHIWGEISTDYIADLLPSRRDKATNCTVVTELLTQGMELERIDEISSAVVAKKVFRSHYTFHGRPIAIISDGGPNSVSNL